MIRTNLEKVISIRTTKLNEEIAKIMLLVRKMINRLLMMKDRFLREGYVKRETASGHSSSCTSEQSLFSGLSLCIIYSINVFGLSFP